MTSLDWTKLGTSPVATTIISLIAGNLLKAKKNLSNVCKILLVLGSFFKSMLENKFNLTSSCIFSIRTLGAVLK